MGFFDFFRKKPDNQKHNSNSTATKNNSGKVEVKLTAHMGVQTRSDDDVIPAEERAKSSYPSKNNGLYPHEILVLDYAPSFYTHSNNYQQFWWSFYGVKDVDAVLLSLSQRGFITVAPITSSIEKKTVAHLKDVLANYGLNSKGKKAVLVQRLIDEISPAELEKIFPERLYMRTEKGEAEVKSEEYVSYIHRHSIEDLDIWSLNRLVYESPSRLSYRDIIWGFLNQKCTEHMIAKNFGLFRNCRYTMATFLHEEERIKSELGMLAEVVFYDLSGAGNNYNPEYLYITAQYLFPYERSLATTAPAVIGQIFRCQEELGLTAEELRSFLAKKMENLYTPIRIFDIEECIDIVFYEKSGDKESLEKIYQKAEKKFYKSHPELKRNPFK